MWFWINYAKISYFSVALICANVCNEKYESEVPSKNQYYPQTQNKKVFKP